jgi:hypothetical protein
MGSGWENPGPAKRVIIAGPAGEFLVYENVAALGTLILSVSDNPGVDDYGNNFPQGLAVYRTASGDHPINIMARSGSGVITPIGTIGSSGASMVLANNQGTNNVSITLADIGGLVLSGGQIGNANLNAYGGAVNLNSNNAQLQIGNAQILAYINSILGFEITNNQVYVIGLPFYWGPDTSHIGFGIDGQGNIYHGAGPGGKFYARTTTYTASVPSGVQTDIVSVLTTQIASDYGNSFTNGAFLAPVAGFYDAYHFTAAVTGSSNTQATIMMNGATVLARNASTPNTSCTVSAIVYLAAGDSVNARVFHNATGNQTMTGIFAVARRL